MIRVAVTTGLDRASEVADHLTEVGVEPVILPCIQIVVAPKTDLDGARSAAASADWVMITSPRVPPMLWSDNPMPAKPVAVVGSATARAVEQAGGHVELVGRTGAAELAWMLAEVAEGSVAVLQAANASPDPVEILTRNGLTVAPAHVYETVPCPPDPDPVDIAMFASPSAVEGWLLSRHLEGVTVAAIGTTTSNTLTAKGHVPDIVSPSPRYRAMALAIESFLRERSLV